MSTRRISGRTAVISGAASGIGRALAQRLSTHGCPVALTDVDEGGLKETEAGLSGPSLARVLDVRDAGAQRDFADEVRDWAPAPLGAVFNNAGVAVSSSVLESVPDDDNWLWDINFHGIVNGTRAFLPILVEQDSGAIVNTSSVFGLADMPNQCLLLGEARRPRVHRFAAPGAAGHRRHGHQRAPGRDQHQHRAQCAIP
jgi:NADP-dependent 3-hydroxy acid dehydrogenase YdfG